MAVMQLILSDVFKDFPKLKLIIPHGVGAMKVYPRLKAQIEKQAGNA